jgi:RNA polymerase primary sigma factor
MLKLRIHSRPQTRRAGNLRRLQPTGSAPAEHVLARLTLEQRRRLQRLLSGPYEYVWHPAFDRVRSLTNRLSGTPGQPGPHVDMACTAVTPSAPGKPGVLSAEQEHELFHRFNYCRYRAFCLLRRCGGPLGERAARALLRWNQLADEIRTLIIRANTSLVWAMATRSRVRGLDSAELVSEGNLALLQCVDRFDCSRGCKFSTYACRAILASFSRARCRWTRDHARCHIAHDQAVRATDCQAGRLERGEPEEVDELRNVLSENTAGLSAAERRVLEARFSLSASGGPGPTRLCSLRAVGVMLGVSGERVRQVQEQAIDKLRAVLVRRLAAAS